MSVFLVQEPRVPRNGKPYDFSAAAEHGDLKTVLPAVCNPSKDWDYALDLARHRMALFNASTDHILWAGGDPVALIAVTFVLHEMGVLNFSFLRWERDSADRSVGWYQPVNLDITGVQK